MKKFEEIIQKLMYSIYWVSNLNLFFKNKKSGIKGFMIPYEIEKDF